MANKIILDIEKVSQWFETRQGRLHVLHDINIKIVQGQFVALVGPSGCGKSTLLNAILGTVPPKLGTIRVAGKPVNGPNRDVGMVYQHRSLYDFMTAEKNVAFGLMLDQTNFFTRLIPWYWWPLRKRHLKEARELLTKFKLGHAHKHYPEELSGGMKQRVSVAQSLIMKPKILLLDEPFSALDEAMKREFQEMILGLYQENVEAKKRGEDPPYTVVMITHSIEQAFYVSDRIIGLSNNWFQQLAKGQEVIINGLPRAGRITGKVCGATKMWDRCAPVYHPDDPRDFELFYAAQQELDSVVLKEDAPMSERNSHVSFWHDLEQGVGTGITMMRSHT